MNNYDNYATNGNAVFNRHQRCDQVFKSGVSVCRNCFHGEFHRCRLHPFFYYGDRITSMVSGQSRQHRRLPAVCCRRVIINIDAAIIAETITIRKNYRLKIPDAIIAATAVVLNRTLVGDNDKDFEKIPNLKYINPRTL